MDIIIKILPPILTIILLFMPDLVYKIGAKKRIISILSKNKINGTTNQNIILDPIKANYDFIAFTSSGLSLILGLFFGLNKNV